MEVDHDPADQTSEADGHTASPQLTHVKKTVSFASIPQESPVTHASPAASLPSQNGAVKADGTDSTPRSTGDSVAADHSTPIPIKTEKTEPLASSTASTTRPPAVTVHTTTLLGSPASLPLPPSSLASSSDGVASKDASSTASTPSSSSSLSVVSTSSAPLPPANAVAPTPPQIRGTFVSSPVVRTKRAVVLPPAKFEETTAKRPRSMDGKLLVGDMAGSIILGGSVLAPTNTIPCQRGCTTVFTYTPGDPSSLRRAKEARSKHHQRRHKREKESGAIPAAGGMSSPVHVASSLPRQTTEESQDSSRQIPRAPSPKRGPLDNGAQCNHCCPRHCGGPPAQAAAAANAMRAANMTNMSNMSMPQNMNAFRSMQMQMQGASMAPSMQAPTPQAMPFLGQPMAGQLMPNMMYPAGLPNYPPFEPRLYDPRFMFPMFPPAHAVPQAPMPMMDMYAQQYQNQLDMLAHSGHPVPFANSHSHPQSADSQGPIAPPAGPGSAAGVGGARGPSRAPPPPPPQAPPQPRFPPASSSSSTHSSSDADSGSEKTV